MKLRDREVRFYPAGLSNVPTLGAVLECAECGALVRRDDENVAERTHEQSHRDLWAMLRALRDGKVDNGEL